MVNFINIYSLSIEELSGVVNHYPWFAAARMEFCKRCCELGVISEAQISDTALYIGNRRLLSDLVRAGSNRDFSDKDAEKLLNSYISDGTSEKKAVVVLGSDYFNQEEYNKVQQSDDNYFDKITTKTHEYSYIEDENDEFMDFCTETLAKLYVEQECYEQAIKIYSKLSLRYPEKNAYFASLIDEIKQKEL